MKNFSAIRSYGLLGILLLLGTGAAQGQSFGADKLKCEQETDPIGIETQTPRFSWQLYAPTRGAVQTAYQIIVSDTPEAVERGTGNVWDSKKIASSQSLLVPYAGEPLEAAKKYYWSVRVWDGTKKRPRGRAPHLSQWDCYRRPTGREHGGSHSNPTSTA